MSLIDDARNKTPKLRLGGNEPASTPPPPPSPPAAPAQTPDAPPAPPTIPPSSTGMNFTPPAADPASQPKPPPPPQTKPAAKPVIPPAVPPTTAATSPEKPNKPRPAGIAIAIGILAILVLIAAGSIYWLFIAADSPEETIAKAEPIPAKETAPTPPDSTPESVSEISAKTTATAESLQEETTLAGSLNRRGTPVPSHGTHPTAETLSIRETATIATTSSVLPETAPAHATPANAAPAPELTTPIAIVSENTAPQNPAHPLPDPDPLLIALVETMPISGIRPAGNESRAMINGELYLVGDQIAGTDLRFIATNAYQLLFQDSRGAIYRRNF